MLGKIFQQMYTMVDTMVVGQGVGVEALASLGSADGPNWLVLGVITGFTQGFSLLRSQRFGAGDTEGLHRGIAHSLVLSAIAGILLTILGVLLVPPSSASIGYTGKCYGWGGNVYDDLLCRDSDHHVV